MHFQTITTQADRAPALSRRKAGGGGGLKRNAVCDRVKSLVANGLVMVVLSKLTRASQWWAVEQRARNPVKRSRGGDPAAQGETPISRV
jgi:hypothetical protein